MFQANSCIFHGIFKIHEKCKLIMSKISFRRGISENVNHENSINVELSNDILENKTLIQAKWFQVSVWAVKLLWVFSHKKYNPVPQFPSREFAGSRNHNRPIRLTQCCTQFKSLGDKILCVLHLHYNVAFTFKWYGNSWNKTFYSQRIWIGYNIELISRIGLLCSRQGNKLCWFVTFF